MIPAKITAIRQGTPTVRVFTLEYLGQSMDFRAGQWVDFYVEFDGEMQVGGYSMTSSPLVRDSVEFAIKQADVNPVSRFLHERAQLGQEVDLDGGQGECFYEAGGAEALVLVAGGIGITPIMSIVRYACEATPHVPVLLLYSATTYEELLYRDELERLAAAHPGLRCEFHVTREAPPPGLVAGRIDAARLAATAALDGFPGATYFVCGPTAMIDDSVEALRALAIPDARIRFERWW